MDRDEGESHQIWNFDSEMAGTLPKNFVVGTLVGGRLAGDCQVIDMKKSLRLFHDLDRREHLRIKKVFQVTMPPSSPQVMAQLKNRGFAQDYNVVLVQGPRATDFDLNVSLLPVTGKADMGCGLIWSSIFGFTA